MFDHALVIGYFTQPAVRQPSARSPLLPSDAIQLIVWEASSRKIFGASRVFPITTGARQAPRGSLATPAAHGITDTSRHIYDIAQQAGVGRSSGEADRKRTPAPRGRHQARPAGRWGRLAEDKKDIKEAEVE